MSNNFFMAEKGVDDTSNSPDKPKKCNFCKITCPNIYSYAEHLESKEHVKGIMKNKYGEKYLEAKAKLDQKIAEGKTRVSSKEDSEGFDSSKDSVGNSSSDEDDVYSCEQCNTVCTGFLNYKLHLSGKKHSKTLEKLKLLKKLKHDKLLPEKDESPEKDEFLNSVLTKTFFSSSGMECKSCNKKCSGPKSYQQHCNSEGHKKKLAEKELMKDKVYSKNENNDGEDNSFDYCDICQKGFTGPLAYKQHMEGNNHLKQKKHHEKINEIKDLAIINEDDKLLCKHCEKTFSGPVPFMDHLKSSAHTKLKKKSALMENLQKEHPEMLKTLKSENSDDDNSAEKEAVVLTCDTCHMVFTGPESARDHFRSLNHKKAIKRKEEYRKYKEIKKTPKAVSGKKLNIEEKVSADIESSNDEEEYDIISDI